MRWFVLALTACLVVLTAAPAATGDRASQRRALERNKALWADQHLRNYRFVLQVSCFCPGAARPVTVTVRNGRPSGATGAHTTVDTVPEMFARIRSALYDRGAGTSKVTYDRRRGYPRTASLDPVKRAIDDEISWTVTRFRPLSPR